MQHDSGNRFTANSARQAAATRRTAALDYMQAMLGQLRTMAEAERCDMLAYLIEMAYVEAGDIIRGERPLRTEQPRRSGVG